VPSLAGLLGVVLVAASPQRPGITVLLVAAGLGTMPNVSAVWSGIISACLSTTSYGVVNAHIPSAASLAP